MSTVQRLPALPLIFQGVHAFINDDLSLHDAEECAHIIEKNGGTAIRAQAGADPMLPRFDAATVTHVVAASSHFQEAELWAEADQESASATSLRENHPAVVTMAWIRRSQEVGYRLCELNYSADPSKFFSGVIVCCTNMERADAMMVVAAVRAHGGDWRSKVSREVTHLITPNGRKSRKTLATAAQYKAFTLVVHEQWVSESLLLQQHRDPAPFMFSWDEVGTHLVHPPAMPSPLQPSIVRDNISARPSPEVDGRGRLTLQEDLEGRDKARRAGKAGDRGSFELPHLAQSPLKGKAILFSAAVTASAKHMLPCLRTYVSNAGGTEVKATKDAMPQAVRNADIVICQYRNEPEFEEAFANGKLVGNIPYIWCVLASNRFISPLDNLGHYPIPKEKVAGAEKLLVTVTGYKAPVRDILKEMLAHAGIPYSGSLDRTTTHIVVGSVDSDKYRSVLSGSHSARPVNHLWIQETYSRWEIADDGKERFRLLRTGADMGQTFEQLPVNESAVQKWIEEQKGPLKRLLTEDPEDDQDTGALKKKKKRLSHSIRSPDRSAEEQPSVPRRETRPATRSRTSSPRKDPADEDLPDVTMSPVPTRVAVALTDQAMDTSEDTVLSPVRTTVSNAPVEEAADQKDGSTVATKTHHTPAPKSKKQVSSSSSKASRSNTTAPSSSSKAPSSGSKAHSSVADVPTSSTKGSSSTVAKTPKATAKTASVEAKVKASASKTSKSPSKSDRPHASPDHLKFTATGVELDKIFKAKGDKPSKHQEGLLRIKLVDEVVEGSTQLVVAGKLSRTRKMLSAISLGIDIVNPSWLIDSLRDGERKDPKLYRLKDLDKEAELGDTLSAALARRASNGPLLTGHVFHFTRGIDVADDLRASIRAAGGMAPAKYVTDKNIGEFLDDLRQQGTHHLISCEKDKRVWNKLEDEPCEGTTEVDGEIQKSGMQVPVWDKELVASGLLLQRMEWQEHRLLGA